MLANYSNFKSLQAIIEIKKDASGEAFLVVPPGLEPGQAEPKSDVLPLHHGTIPLVLSFEF